MRVNRFWWVLRTHYLPHIEQKIRLCAFTHSECAVLSNERERERERVQKNKTSTDSRMSRAAVMTECVCMGKHYTIDFSFLSCLLLLSNGSHITVRYNRVSANQAAAAAAAHERNDIRSNTNTLTTAYINAFECDYLEYVCVDHV